jgi:hypothetical protein
VEDRLQIAARQQQQYLALADANLIGPDGYPVSADLHARRGDRFALTYNPHGATAPEPPSPANIFSWGTPFQRVSDPIFSPSVPRPLAIEYSQPRQKRQNEVDTDVLKQTSDTAVQKAIWIQKEKERLADARSKMAADQNKQAIPGAKPKSATRSAEQRRKDEQKREEARRLREEKRIKEEQAASTLENVQAQRRLRRDAERAKGVLKQAKVPGARPKAATRTAQQRMQDEQILQQLKYNAPPGWLSKRPIPAELAPRWGRGKPVTKEVLNIPQPILEYFDVKNDPHFIRAPKHQPQK